MGRHGENLPAALSWLEREHPEAFEKLLDHVRLAVPTVERVETGYAETHELGLFLSEHGVRRKMYSSELSDGTVRTIGIFVPLIYPEYSLVVIEEPENCVHPWVTRHFVAACRDHSLSKQIVLTTHSPIVVSELHENELFVVERQEGQTQILPATAADKEVREILRSGIMDLGSYWDSGAMGAVPVQLTLFENQE